MADECIYKIPFHKQACHKVLCREQRIINAAKTRRQNKIDRTRNRTKHTHKEMAGYCWHVLVCIMMLYEVSVCFFFLSNSIPHKVHCTLSVWESNMSQQPINASQF